VGLPDGARSLSNDEVDWYNALQVRLARDYLIHRPAASFPAATIAGWRT
jgi:hypothetical protein